MIAHQIGYSFRLQVPNRTKESNNVFQQLHTQRLYTQQLEIAATVTDEDGFDHILPQADGATEHAYERRSTEHHTSTEQQLLEDNPWDCGAQQPQACADEDSDGGWVVE